MTIAQAESTRAGIEDLLKGHQYINLITYRKTGVGVPTPVWFALEDGKIYVLTQAKAGKAKRIRNNGQVHFAPCTVRGQELGPRVSGTARILSPDEAPTAIRALDRKYGLMKRMFDVFMRGERVYFEIRPAPAE